MCLKSFFFSSCHATGKVAFGRHYSKSIVAENCKSKLRIVNFFMALQILFFLHKTAEYRQISHTVLVTWIARFANPPCHVSQLLIVRILLVPSYLTSKGRGGVLSLRAFSFPRRQINLKACTILPGNRQQPGRGGGGISTTQSNRRNVDTWLAH